MTESDLLSDWQLEKLRGPWYRLETATAVSFEYRGAQRGHPSNYAGLSLQAESADSLSVACPAIFPETLTESYCRQLVAAMARGFVDGLFAHDYHAYRGCALTIVAVQWDDVMSSEVAFYRAAQGAIGRLQEVGRWKLVQPT